MLAPTLSTVLGTPANGLVAQPKMQRNGPKAQPKQSVTQRRMLWTPSAMPQVMLSMQRVMPLMLSAILFQISGKFRRDLRKRSPAVTTVQKFVAQANRQMGSLQL